MKIADIPQEFKDKVAFACKVCRAKFKSATGRATDCACRVCSKSVCPYIEQVIKECLNEKNKERPI